MYAQQAKRRRTGSEVYATVFEGKNPDRDSVSGWMLPSTDSRRIGKRKNGRKHLSRDCGKTKEGYNDTISAIVRKSPCEKRFVSARSVIPIT